MSRLFDDAQNEYLTHAAAVKNATPLAMVCWFNSDSNSLIQILMSITDASDDLHTFALEARGDVAGDPVYAQINDGTGWSDFAKTTSGYSINTWHHGCAIYATSTDRRAFIDGGSKGTDAVSKTPNSAVLDTTSIAGAIRPGNLRPVSGHIAEAAIYDLSAWPGATDSDKANNFERILLSLAKGFTPLHFPLGLVAYWPLIRGLNDKVGGYNMTASGTVAAAHPRIIQPCGVL